MEISVEELKKLMAGIPDAGCYEEMLRRDGEDRLRLEAKIRLLEEANVRLMKENADLKAEKEVEAYRIPSLA